MSTKCYNLYVNNTTEVDLSSVLHVLSSRFSSFLLHTKNILGLTTDAKVCVHGASRINQSQNQSFIQLRKEPTFQLANTYKSSSHTSFRDTPAAAYYHYVLCVEHKLHQRTST